MINKTLILDNKDCLWEYLPQNAEKSNCLRSTYVSSLSSGRGKGALSCLLWELPTLCPTGNNQNIG